MLVPDPWLDPRFHSFDGNEMELAAQARDASAWLGTEYVTGQLEEADLSGVPHARAAAVDSMQQELLNRMDALQLPAPVQDRRRKAAILLLLLS